MINNKSLLSLLLNTNSQFSDSQRYNHEALAVLLKHQLKLKKEQVYVLAGSEDLYALLPNFSLKKEGAEVFILIRPYIHSMGIYLCQTKQGLVCYLFDSQNWQLRYYPTRLILNAIHQCLPAVTLYWVNNSLQPKHDQVGCALYTIALLRYCRENKLPINYPEEQMAALANFPRGYQLNTLEPKLIAWMGWVEHNSWVKQQQQDYNKILEAILENFYIQEGVLDWDKIRYVVQEMQGNSLLNQRSEEPETSYSIEVNQKQASITFQFHTKDFIFANLLTYSSKLFPLEAKENLHYLLEEHPDLQVISHFPERYALTYKAADLPLLKAAFESLDVGLYWQKHLRQQTALKALSQQVTHAIELKLLCQENKGGFDQYLVQSALQYYFAKDKGIFIPSIQSYETLKHLDFAVLKKEGVETIVFSYEAYPSHQVAVWMDLNQTPYVAELYDSKDDFFEEAALFDFLGLDKDTLIIDSKKSNFPLQEDNWSCGVFVITHILWRAGKELLPFDLESMASRYLRVALIQTNKEQHAAFNQQSKQALLAVLQQTKIPLAEDLTDFLRLECTEKTNQHHLPLFSRPLVQALRAYRPCAEKHGTLILEVACLLEREPQFSQYMAALLRILDEHSQLLPSQVILSRVQGQYYTNEKTMAFVEALEFEVGTLEQESRLLELLKMLLQQPFNLSECLGLLDCDYPLTQVGPLDEVPYALILKVMHHLGTHRQSLESSINRHQVDYLAYESNKKKVILQLESLLAKPISQAIHDKIDDWLSVLPTLMNQYMSYLTPQENARFLRQIMKGQTPLKSELLLRAVPFLTDEQLLKIVPFDALTSFEMPLWLRLIKKPLLLGRALNGLQDFKIVSLMTYQASHLPLLHIAAQMPESIGVILERLSASLRFAVLQIRDEEGNTICHDSSLELMQVILQWITPAQLKQMLHWRNYLGETICSKTKQFTQQGLAKANTILQFLASHEQNKEVWAAVTAANPSLQFLFNNYGGLYKTIWEVEPSLLGYDNYLIERRNLDLAPLQNINTLLVKSIGVDCQNGITKNSYSNIRTYWKVQQERIAELNKINELDLFFPLTEQQLQIKILRGLQLQKKNWANIAEAIEAMEPDEKKRKELWTEVLFHLEGPPYTIILSQLQLYDLRFLERAIQTKNFKLFNQLVNSSQFINQPIVFRVINEALAQSQLSVSELITFLAQDPLRNHWLLSVYIYRTSTKNGIVCKAIEDNNLKKLLADELNEINYFLYGTCSGKLDEIELKKHINYYVLSSSNSYMFLNNLSYLLCQADQKKVLSLMVKIIQSKIALGQVKPDSVVNELIRFDLPIFESKVKKKVINDYILEIKESDISKSEQLDRLMVFFNLLRSNSSAVKADLCVIILDSLMDYVACIDEAIYLNLKSFNLSMDALLEKGESIKKEFYRQNHPKIFSAKDYLKLNNERLLKSKQLLFLSTLAQTPEKFLINIQEINGLSLFLMKKHLVNFNFLDVLNKLVNSYMQGAHHLDYEKEKIIFRALLACRDLEDFDFFLRYLPQPFYLKEYDEWSLLVHALNKENFILANYLINLPDGYQKISDKISVLSRAVDNFPNIGENLLYCLGLDFKNNYSLILKFFDKFSDKSLFFYINKFNNDLILKALNRPLFPYFPYFIKNIVKRGDLEESVHKRIAELFLHSISNQSAEYLCTLYKHYICNNKFRFYDLNNNLSETWRNKISQQNVFFSPYEWYREWIESKLDDEFQLTMEKYSSFFRHWNFHLEFFEFFNQISGTQASLDKTTLQTYIFEFFMQKKTFHLGNTLETMVSPNLCFKEWVDLQRQILEAVYERATEPELKNLISAELQKEKYAYSTQQLNRFFIPSNLVSHIITPTTSLRMGKN